jgi:cysteine desulfurase/selenocysteine lyase
LRRIVTGGEPKPVTVGVPSAEPAYPKARAASPTAAAEPLIEAFEMLGDWPSRYQYLIEMGKKIPPLPANLKTEANRVSGCQSTVYLSARVRPGTSRVFSGQKVADVLAFDVEGFFGRLDLDQHLTLGRRTGLASMVQRIRALAESAANGAA